MATACGADIIFVAYAWLRELLILTVTVMVIAISAIAIVVALIRGAREGRRHGSVPAYVGWNLGWTLAGLVLVFVVLPTMAVWAWKLHWSVDDAHGRQRAAWTLPLWNAAPGGLGKALEDVLDSRAMRSGRNRDHLLDTLRRLLVAYDQELAPADRTTLATLPARLRKFETRPPDARREIDLAHIEGAVAWQLEKPSLAPAIAACSEPRCAEGAIQSFFHWCDRLPQRCRQRFATPEGQEAIQRAEALGVAAHVVAYLRSRHGLPEAATR